MNQKTTLAKILVLASMVFVSCLGLEASMDEPFGQHKRLFTISHSSDEGYGAALQKPQKR